MYGWFDDDTRDLWEDLEEEEEEEGAMYFDVPLPYRPIIC